MSDWELTTDKTLFSDDDERNELLKMLPGAKALFAVSKRDKDKWTVLVTIKETMTEQKFDSLVVGVGMQFLGLLNAIERMWRPECTHEQLLRRLVRKLGEEIGRMDSKGGPE